MNSIGILYTTKQSKAPRESVEVNADLHINFWKLPTESKNYNRFIDIGVMVYEMGDDIDALYFYLPFVVKVEDLEDLGKPLSHDNLLCVLFGADYEIRNNISTSYTYADTQTEGKHSFWMYQLEKPNFHTEQKQSGTIVKISIKTHPNNSAVIKEGKGKKDSTKYNLYVRFRVNNLTDKKQYVTESISNDFLQSAFSRTEMVDLYVNEKRDFDKSDYQDLSNIGSFFQFSKFHFFFVGSTQEEAIYGHTAHKDSRLLDAKKWEKYIGNHNPKSKMCIAYHWNVDVSKGRSKVFVRTIYSSPNLWKISKYTAYALGISSVGALIYDFIKLSVGFLCSLL